MAPFISEVTLRSFLEVFRIMMQSCGIALAFFVDVFQFACTKCLDKRRSWLSVVVVTALEFD